MTSITLKPVSVDSKKKFDDMLVKYSKDSRKKVTQPEFFEYLLNMAVMLNKYSEDSKSGLTQPEFFKYLMDMAVLYDSETMENLETATKTGQYTKTQIIADAVKKSAKDIAGRVKAMENNTADSIFVGAQKRVDDVVRYVMAQNDKAKSQWDKVYITSSFFYGEDGRKAIGEAIQRKEGQPKAKSLNRKAVREYLSMPSVDDMLTAHNKKHGLDDEHNHKAKTKKRFDKL